MARPAAAFRRRGALTVLEWLAFDEHPVDAVVTTREAGFSRGRYESLNLGLHVGDNPVDVIANRAVAAQALGVTCDDLVFGEQAHGASAAVVTDADRGRGAGAHETALPATDALVTACPGVALVVLVADCVPLVLYDPGSRVLAVVHAGWAGTVRGVSAAAVEAMRGLGTRPADVVAAVGPSVAPDRYQVGDDVRRAAQDAFGPRADDVTRPDGTGRWLFDLWTANRLQLLDAGLVDANIHVAGLATGPGTPFYSHRFESPCGRFAALARLTGRRRAGPRTQPAQPGR